ncbi:MAG: tetratricopeptide repeat protein [Candidatus Omnitrophota bacterium]
MSKKFKIQNSKFKININVKYQNLNQIFYYFVICALLFVTNPVTAFAQGAIGDYLCEIAESYYLDGRYEDALHEFNKALLADPENVKARKYVDKLNGESKCALKLKEAKETKIKESALPAGRYGRQAFDLSSGEETVYLSEISIPSSEESSAFGGTSGADLPVIEEPDATLSLKEESLGKKKAAALTGSREGAPEESVLAKTGPKRIESQASPKPKVISERKHTIKPIILEETRPRKLIARNEAEKRKIISSALNDYIKEEKLKKGEASPVELSGEYQVALGATSEGFEWKRANGNLNERDYHILSDAALNNRENTFDHRVFSRFRANLDAQSDYGLSFHTNITVDPWSFTGKTDKFTLRSASGMDSAEIELKYWSATGRIFNETFYTKNLGDSFAIPEIKVEDDMTSALAQTTTFGGTFNIPSKKIHREFQPVRELWFDYALDDAKLRVFPMALSDQALTSDDPLGLSNHHIYWEESPWILKWEPGHFNSGAGARDFSLGKWSDSLAFSTRDSDMVRLTALRGLSFDYQPTDETSFKLTGASPKGLWQEYNSFDNFPLAARLKQGVGDKLTLGTTYTYRLGLNEDENYERDAVNYTWGLDSGYSPVPGTKIESQVAASLSKQDISSSYSSNKRGMAYHLALLGSPDRDLLGLNYNSIKPEETDFSFFKGRLQFTHMGEGFDPALASYRETRKDRFWSRHIHFRKPFARFYSDTDYNEPSLSWDDIAPFAIGDGIDIGRNVFGLRLEASTLDRKLDELFDIRNVHKSNGKYLENVARSETTYKPAEKLTTKVLAIYHDMHQTHAGKDPYLADGSDRIVDNSIIPDDKNPSTKTFSLGANYDFFDWVSAYSIWEYSNDINAAYEAFPRGILNSGSFETFSEYGKTFRRQTTYLYNQYYFPLPPYPFNNAYKFGLTLRPAEKLEIFLDFTRNEYEYAGPITDDINHVGIEIAYAFSEKLKFFTKYAFSEMNDLIMMNVGENVRYENHHNFFFEGKYSFTSDDELAFQFGEFGRSAISALTFDPFGGSLGILDTQHIYRLYYRRKF